MRYRYDRRNVQRQKRPRPSAAETATAAKETGPPRPRIRLVSATPESRESSQQRAAARHDNARPPVQVTGIRAFRRSDATSGRGPDRRCPAEIASKGRRLGNRETGAHNATGSSAVSTTTTRKHNGNPLESFGTAISAAAVATVVATATSMVRLTSSGRSRAMAAFQASRPRPGTSQIASIGIAAPIAILTEAAESANNCGEIAGRT